jgi:hypothetical protein
LKFGFVIRYEIPILSLTLDTNINAHTYT